MKTVLCKTPQLSGTCGSSCHGMCHRDRSQAASVSLHYVSTHRKVHLGSLPTIGLYNLLGLAVDCRLLVLVLAVIAIGCRLVTAPPPPQTLTHISGTSASRNSLVP